MKKKIKSPVMAGKVAKVPVILQMEALECGAAALAMVMAYYNKWIPLEQVRLDCGVSRNGSNAKNILAAARSYNMQARGYRYGTKALKDKGKFPCIIYWKFNHFVVLDGFKGDKAVINDPAWGIVSVSMEEFDKAFTGICLMMEPGEGFVADGNKRSIWDFAAKRLKGTGAAMAFIFGASFLAALMGVINPVFSQIFMDKIITGVNPGWVCPFFFVSGCICSAADCFVCRRGSLFPENPGKAGCPGRCRIYVACAAPAGGIFYPAKGGGY